jgi:hypothetical protein
MSALMSGDLETELVRILRADPELMQVLTVIRDLGLPDWRVFSGAVYQSVWNAKTGRPVGYGRKDYDVGYFDPDTSWDAEDAYIQRVAAAFDEPLQSMVEVRNQARVHIWFPDRFGESYTPLPDTDTALGRFVAPAFAVGVRLEADDSLSIAAPFGLDDLFAMVLRPNPNREPARGWDKAVASAAARWPELTVIPQA